MGALIAVAAAIAFFARFLLRPADTRPWNLVLVSIDTLRADQLSAYGGSVQTPAIDRLQREGVLFESVQTVAPLTLPAHASLFTARWPYTHGVRDNVGFYLRPGASTLASHLKANGYRTGGFVGAFVLDSRFGIDQGFEHYFDEFDALENDVAGGFVSQRSGADVVARAREWMAGVAGESPFFAFVHLFEPHTPYEPPERFVRGSDDTSLYRAEVAYADALFGELLVWLDANDLSERTLVVLTSDHGESLGEHGETTHGYFIYESTLSVPLILRYPGAPAGRRVSGLASLVDVAPTILDLMGLPALHGAEGTSLVRRIGDPASSGEASAYAETFLPRLHYGFSPLRSLRKGRHKLILAPRPELYDLEADPAESHNLFDENPAEAGRLMAELSEIVLADERPEAGAIDLDADSRERLQALGYLGGGGIFRPAETTTLLSDPKDRLEVYHALNDPTLSSLEPADGAAFREALARLAIVVREEPVIPRAHVLYGDLLLKAGKPHEAVRIFGDLAARGESFDAFFGLGVAHQQSGELAAAERAFTRALEIEPQNTKSHFRLSEVEAARGNVEAAERWLTSAIVLSPNRVLREKLATLYMKAGRKKDARAVRAKIAEDFSSDPIASYNLGQTLLVEGDPSGALEMFRAAAELDPNNPDIEHGIGNALLSSGDPRAALEAYAVAVALAPCFAGAHANRGTAFMQIGRVETAIESFRKAISCEPAYIPGYRNLAAALLQSEDLAGAIETLGRAQELSPNDPEIRRQLAELTAYRDRGR